MTHTLEPKSKSQNSSDPKESWKCKANFKANPTTTIPTPEPVPKKPSNLDPNRSGKCRASLRATQATWTTSSTTKTPNDHKSSHFPSTSSCQKANSRHRPLIRTIMCRCLRLDRDKSGLKESWRLEDRYLKAIQVTWMTLWAGMVVGRLRSSSRKRTISCLKVGFRGKATTLETILVGDRYREGRLSGRGTSFKWGASSRGHQTTHNNTVRRKGFERSASRYPTTK